MIKIYGSPFSSAHRCYWTLEELNIPFERMPLDMRQREHKSEAFLKLNPNGKVPCLVDGDLILWESAAIDHYLATQYGPKLLGSTPKEQALVQQWLLWSLLELQPPLVNILIQVMFVPEDKKNPAVIEEAKKKLQPLYEILNQHLKKNQFMVGDTFTMADLTVASIVRINGMTQQSIKEFAELEKWFSAVTSRPAYVKVEAMNR